MACLTSPAELRNKVYDLVATAPVASINHRTGRTDGSYAALTRVCRQIRCEFLPIQRREAKVCLPLEQLGEWIRTATSHPDKAPKLMRLVPDFGKFYYSEIHHVYDLLPLLRLNHRLNSSTVFEIAGAAQGDEWKTPQKLSQTDPTHWESLGIEMRWSIYRRERSRRWFATAVTAMEKLLHHSDPAWVALVKSRYVTRADFNMDIGLLTVTMSDEILHEDDHPDWRSTLDPTAGGMEDMLSCIHVYFLRANGERSLEAIWRTSSVGGSPWSVVWS
ncbi:hypothetical protein DPSP01_014245 [Paraphaeosphaeria sporulosa]